MRTLKLNVAEENILSNKEKGAIVGGSCGCACRYAESGGSSTAANESANKAGGLHSPGMQHIVWEMDESGAWVSCDKWIIIV